MEIAAALVGAIAGAFFAAIVGLFLAKRARHEEERNGERVLFDALKDFTTALSPFLMLTEDEIGRRSFADVKAELQDAHEQFELLTSLVELILQRDRVFGASTLVGMLGILKTLRREQELWERERRAISDPRASREVLKVHVSKLRNSADKMNKHAQRAITSIKRLPPIHARLFIDPDKLTEANSSAEVRAAVAAARKADHQSVWVKPSE